MDEKEALLLAGALEDASEHPVGQAIAREASARLGDLPPVGGIRAPITGRGAGGAAERSVAVGSPQLLADLSWDVPPSLAVALQTAASASRTAVLAGWDGQARAVLVVSDLVRPGACAARPATCRS